MLQDVDDFVSQHVAVGRGLRSVRTTAEDDVLTEGVCPGT